MVQLESPDNNYNISWTYAVGFSKKDTTEKRNKNQALLIASTTKTYVSASILTLVESEELELNQPINKKAKKLLKKSGYSVDEITIKHLLSHTSGIPDYVIPKEASKNYYLGLFNIPSFFGDNVFYHCGF